MIKIICVGKIKERYLEAAIEEYKKRLSKFTKLKIIEIIEEKIDDKIISVEKEKDKIIAQVDSKDYAIVLDIQGIKITSEELAKKIDNILIYSSDITFIIGSSHGLHEEVKKRANLKISFSLLTFPHQLFRVLLLEQIYRSFKIINNEKYHK